MKHVIAIDGPAASGKGTLARKIAEELNYALMDTGALYRAVGYEVLQAGGNPEDEVAALVATNDLKHKLKTAGTDDVLGNPGLRTDETGNAASKVAAMGGVREALLKLQRDFATNPGEAFKGAVLDGRDIGTVICPDAQAKLYITASDEIRAQRRTKELQLKDITVTYEAVLKDMRARDARDTARKAAPMKPADDAFILDTSDLDPAQVLEKALSFIRTRIPG